MQRHLTVFSLGRERRGTSFLPQLLLDTANLKHFLFPFKNFHEHMPTKLEAINTPQSSAGFMPSPNAGRIPCRSNLF